MENTTIQTIPSFVGLRNARGSEPYSIHMTNRILTNPSNGKDISAEIDAAIAATASQATHRKIVYREDSHLSVCVDVGGDRVNY